MKPTTTDLSAFIENYTDETLQVISESSNSIVVSVPFDITKYLVSCLKYYLKEVVGATCNVAATLIDKNQLRITYYGC